MPRNQRLPANQISSEERRGDSDLNVDIEREEADEYARALNLERAIEFMGEDEFAAIGRNGLALHWHGIL